MGSVMSVPIYTATKFHIWRVPGHLWMWHEDHLAYHRVDCGGDWQRSWLLNWILGRVILVADPWLQGLVTKILQGAGTHNAQTPRKIYCRVFSEEACGQFSIRFVHKCIVWIEKFATERSYPCHFATTSSSPHVALRHRQEQLPHRCKWCLSQGALDGLNDKISPEIPSTIGV